MEAGGLEGRQETVLPQGAGDAAAPEFGVGLQVGGHVLVADDVRDDGAAAALEHPKDLAEEKFSAARRDEVEDAVAHDGVDAAVGDHGAHEFELRIGVASRRQPETRCGNRHDDRDDDPQAERQVGASIFS